jgi:hypothetical protein
MAAGFIATEAKLGFVDRIKMTVVAGVGQVTVLL